MLAIFTFVSTILLATLPNNDTYTVTTETFFGQNMIETKTELIADWQFDDSKGWIYEMPEVNVELGVVSQTADSELDESGMDSDPVMHLPAIDVNCSKS